MADTVGFEPTIESPLYTLSRRAPSTTRPRVRIWRGTDAASGRVRPSVPLALSQGARHRRADLALCAYEKTSAAVRLDHLRLTCFGAGRRSSSAAAQSGRDSRGGQGGGMAVNRFG